MPRQEKYLVGIAESAPIIASGFSIILKRINNPILNIIEITSDKQLLLQAGNAKLDILLINPTFGGIFDPVKFRKEAQNPNLKIIAIEFGKLGQKTSALYDAIIHVTDDADIIKERIKSVCRIKDEPAEEKETLSAREKEIISFVVKGLTNQEIADQLFLSVHTVITHRRNIARKLEIHSATGLTIYAIVNKIVDIRDVVH